MVYRVYSEIVLYQTICRLDVCFCLLLSRKNVAVTRDLKTSTEPLGFTRFALLLHSLPNVGEKTLTRLLHHITSRRLAPETCLQWSMEEWQTRCELDARAATTLCEQQDALLAQAEELARVTRQHNIHVLTPHSLSYPARLERFDDSPPPIVYALGNLSLLPSARSLEPSAPAASTTATHPPASPTRKPAAKSPPLYQPKADNNASNASAEDREKTPAATPLQTAAPAPFTFSIAVSNGADNGTLKRLEEIATILIGRGCVPVTGHDRTPYKRLALVAQRQNRPTIYVLDRGLRDAHGPAFDRPLFAAARIRETVFDVTRDLALSPFRIDDHALGANLRRRDRMLYALADLIIALDVRAGGGMAAECLRAREQGRMVWVASGGRDGNAALREAGCMEMPEV